MDQDTVRELLEHNTWANDRLLEVVMGLEKDQFTRSLGGSHPSLQATFTHILWAEWLWLERWRGGSPDAVFAPDAFPSACVLRLRWQEIQAEQSAFIEALDDRQLLSSVSYVNQKGETWQYPLWHQIYHLIEHSAYHRGQVTNQLRLLGLQSRATDYLVFRDEQAAGRAGAADKRAR